MSRIIDTDMIGPTVRDVMTFGPNVFPDCIKNWPEVSCPILSASLLHDINKWCITNIGYSNYYQAKGIWYFTHKDDATLFKLTWT
jgi:hypothetical protein